MPQIKRGRKKSYLRAAIRGPTYCLWGSNGTKGPIIRPPSLPPQFRLPERPSWVDDGRSTELLNGELFYGLKELKVIVGNWVKHHNTERPESSLGYRPPAPPQAWHPRPARGALGPALVSTVY